MLRLLRHSSFLLKVWSQMIESALLIVQHV